MNLYDCAICYECGQEVGSGLFPGKCPHCGSAWMRAKYKIAALSVIWTEKVAQRPANLWRYRELLPFADSVIPVSMGEGWTPLTRAEGLQSELDHPTIWIKDERQQPTGSFKDRQAAFTISALKAEGVDEIVLASTGNAAAAYAAYCARARIKLWVFLTSSVPAEKMRELALYGAEVIKISGTYDQAKLVAENFANRRGILYDQGAKGILGIESMKTVAFEIAEQLGWHAPDWYIQAVSGGLGPLGVIKGFEELCEAGLVEKVPKLGIVQVEGCAPMVRAWEQGLDVAEPVVPDTLITILSTGNPGLSYQIQKKAIDHYGGAMVSISDGDTFRAMRRVARLEGFSVEPAASVAFGGLEKLIGLGYINSSESVVVNCSGHTFSAEKHALEDRLVIDLDVNLPNKNLTAQEGLEAAFAHLDERITTIVIIDDNPSDTRLIRRLLEKYRQYRIFEAHNGPDGVDLAKQRQPELILLDLTIPGMDGFEILAELKNDARTGDIPVIIISGKDLTPDQAVLLDGTVQSVWQKGNFRGKELIDHITQVIGSDEEIDVDQHPIEEFEVIDEEQSITSLGEDKRQLILVVDDNLWDARLMRRLFETHGNYEVVEVNSTLQALEILKQRTPDLVILDLIFPEGDNRDVLDELQSKYGIGKIPVVVVSAKEIEPEERVYLNQRVDSIWLKTMLDRNSLLTHVENILVK